MLDADIELDFKEQLKILVPHLLAPENLVVKQIGGHKIRAKELVHYFQSYMAIYKGDELPEPKSMLEVFIKCNIDWITFAISNSILDEVNNVLLISMTFSLKDNYVIALFN